MNILNDLAALNRPSFFDGQRLAADDLQSVEQLNREMRWLHNLSLHQPGIGNGYAVVGRKGDSIVAVGPGYAIDADGREIVLTATQTLPVPPVASEDDGSPATYDLTVSYADTNLEEVESRALDCGNGRGVIRYREKPVFCWVHLVVSDLDNGNLSVKDANLKALVDQGEMIVLARAEVLNCKLNKDVTTAQRRSARPPVQPYIACGRLAPVNWVVRDFVAPAPAEANSNAPSAVPAQATNATVLSLVQPAAVIAGPITSSVAPFVLTATVSTSAAGFLTTPSYTARIAYLPTYDAAVIENGLKAHIEGVVNITTTTPQNFAVEVSVIVVPLGESRLPPNVVLDVFNKVLGIEWMGVEG